MKRLSWKNPIAIIFDDIGVKMTRWKCFLVDFFDVKEWKDFLHFCCFSQQSTYFIKFVGQFTPKQLAAITKQSYTTGI